MTTPADHRLRLMTLASVLACTVGCDQITKGAARLWLSPAAPRSYLQGTLKLTLVRNPGAFLSFGAQMPPQVRFFLFSTLVGLILLAGLIYLALSRRLSNGLAFALTLVLGGGIGNLIDRLAFSGAVTDFLVLSAGPLRTGVFNVADVAVLLGAGLAFLHLWRERREPDAA